MLRKSVSTLRFLFAGALVVLVGVTCTDGSLTGPGSHRGALTHLAFAPAFTKAAGEIFQSLEEFGFAVNNVHVRLAHANGTFAKDTTIVIGSGQDSVVIEMAVNLNSIQEELDASIELRDDNTVLFSGTQSVTAKVGTTSPPPPPIAVDYTGPGAGATTLTLTPSDTAVLAGDSVTFRPSAKNGAGQNVPDLALAWSVRDDTRGAVNANGVFKASIASTRGGTYVIARLLSGPKDSAHVNVVPAATNVAVLSGADQVGTVGKPLGQPIVVEARADDNLPVPFARLTFGVVSGGGSVSQTIAFADANGHATVALTLGTTAGANTLQVSGTGITALQVFATGVADVAAKLGVVQQPSAGASSGTVLSTQPAARIQDIYGNAVAASNMPVTASLTSPNGRTLSGTLTVNTDASGIAQFSDLKISGPPGAASLTFSQGTLASAVSSTINVVIGTAVTIALEGSASLSLVAGTASSSTSAVFVSDAGGNGVANTDVRIVLTSGQTTVNDNVFKTDATGRVLLSSVPLPTAVGGYFITASSGSLTGSPLTAQVNITHAAAHHLRFAQQPASSIDAAVLMPIVVEALDEFNNRVTTGASSTANVTLGVGGGTTGAVLGPNAAATTQAAVAGVATFNVSVDLVGIGYALTATLGSLPVLSSNTFSVTGGLVANIAVLAGDGVGLLKGEEAILQARVTDASGATIAGAPVTFTIISGGGTLNSATGPYQTTTDANGNVSADYRPGTSGVQVARASTSTSSVDFHVFMAETLVVIRQPPINPIAGVMFPAAEQPVVQLQDLKGNQVKRQGFAIEVSRVLDPPNQDVLSVLLGTLTMSTDANGTAAFTDLALGGNVAIVRLHFQEFTSVTPTVAPAESQQIVVSAGPAVRLAFLGVPTTVVQGTQFPTYVAAYDNQGNLATGFTGNVALAIGTNPSNGTLSGTTTLAAVTGLASFSDLSINNVGVGYTLTASATGLIGATSAAFDVESALPFVSVSAGDKNSCGVNAAGAAYCWGLNAAYGQLGNGSMTDSHVPTAVSGGLTFQSLGAGIDRSCGLTTSGAAYCWGYGGNGELGAGPGAVGTIFTTPNPVVGGLTFTKLSVGLYRHNCGIAIDGSAYCWGYNGWGNIGDSSVVSVVSSPSLVKGGLFFIDVMAGTSHSCGVTATLAAYCWGSNAAGELGIGSLTQTFSTAPLPVTGGLTFTTVTGGNEHTCGLTTVGAAYCWGEGTSGQLGNGSTSLSSSPVPVSGGLVFVSLSAGDHHTCGVTINALAYCWGANSAGELGDGSPTDRSTPVAVSGGLTFSSVSAGAQYSCGVTTSGAAYCWGTNGSGQLGNGTTTPSLVPVPVSPP